jgi:hypothetical protein
MIRLHRPKHAGDVVLAVGDGFGWTHAHLSDADLKNLFEAVVAIRASAKPIIREFETNGGVASDKDPVEP